MTVFDAAADVLFEDQNLGQDATYYAGGKGAGLAVRILLASPQRIETFGQSGAIVYDRFASIRISEVASPAKGDTLKIGGTMYRIETNPQADAKGLLNRCGLYRL